MYKTVFITLSLFLSVQLYGQSTNYNALYMVDGNQEQYQYRSHVYLESLEPGSNATCAKGGVDLVLTYVRMSKTSGTSKDPSVRDLGINSVLLAVEGSKVYSEECEYSSHVENADAVSCLGQGTFIDIVKGQFRLSRSGCSSIFAADGGRVRVTDAELSISASKCQGLRTENGGTIEATKLTGGTSSLVSPLFDVKGTVTAQKCRLSADRWSIARIGGGKLELVDNELKSNGLCGIICSKSDESKAVVELKKNKLQVSEGPLFMIDGADIEITVEGNSINLKSTDLLVFENSPEDDSIMNPGCVILNVGKQKLKGDVTINAMSTLSINLNKGSKLNSAVNADNVADSHIDVVIKNGSQWEVCEDSYISSLVFEKPVEKGVKQIKGKHTVYYDSSNPANAPLGGREYKTGGGGMLKPL